MFCETRHCSVDKDAARGDKETWYPHRLASIGETSQQRKLGKFRGESPLPVRAPPHPPSAILQMATSVLDPSSTLVGCCPSPVALPAVLGTTHFILGSLSAQSALFPHC